MMQRAKFPKFPSPADCVWPHSFPLPASGVFRQATRMLGLVTELSMAPPISWSRPSPAYRDPALPVNQEDGPLHEFAGPSVACVAILVPSSCSACLFSHARNAQRDPRFGNGTRLQLTAAILGRMDTRDTRRIHSGTFVVHTGHRTQPSVSGASSAGAVCWVGSFGLLGLWLACDGHTHQSYRGLADQGTRGWSAWPDERPQFGLRNQAQSPVWLEFWGLLWCPEGLTQPKHPPPTLRMHPPTCTTRSCPPGVTGTDNSPREGLCQPVPTFASTHAALLRLCRHPFHSFSLVYGFHLAPVARFTHRSAAVI